MAACAGEACCALTRARLPVSVFGLTEPDPPYVGGERDYGPGVFAQADFERLAEQLAGTAGRFILSINDHPIARAAFSRFAIEEVATTWTISTAATRGGKRVTELIIRG